MICCAEQDIQIQPAEGTSGKETQPNPICTTSSAGYFIGDKMKRIKLTQGKFAIVDDEDYDWLMQWKWHAQWDGRHWKATRWERGWKKGKGKRKLVFMHREILKTPKNLFTDHINGNGLDNRKINLRYCTNAQNQWNQLPHKKCVSKYKGVSFRKDISKWQVYIRKNRKITFVGHYKDEFNAAKSYDAKAKELFGEFALTNF